MKQTGNSPRAPACLCAGLLIWNWALLSTTLRKSLKDRNMKKKQPTEGREPVRWIIDRAEWAAASGPRTPGGP